MLNLSPLLLALLAFFLGFLLALAWHLWQRPRWVPRQDWEAAQNRLQPLLDLQSRHQQLQGQMQSLQDQQSQLQQDKARLEATLEQKEQQLRQGHQQHELSQSQLAQLQADLSQAKQDKASLQSALEQEKTFAQERSRQLEKDREQFKLLAQEFVKEQGQKLGEHQQNQLKQLLEPFEKNLGQFKQKVEEVHLNEAKGRAELSGHIQSLKSLNQQMAQETLNLTKALKGDSKVQGGWGEVQLEGLLEGAGLIKGVHFFTQASYQASDETGRSRLRPDVVIQLPQKRQLILDAKVSLTAYERMVNATTPEEEAQALSEHLQSLRNHVKGLSQKRYEDIPEIQSLDFVMMFVPLEPAFLAALKEDPQLFKQAYDQNVILVCPSTLMVNLRTVENLWRMDKQNRNTVQIAEEAGKLYDKFVGFVGDLQGVGKQLEKTRESYDAAMNKLKEGRGDLITRVEKLRQLGAKANKQLPTEFLPEPEEEQISLPED